jgi:hypothetical protein
LPPRRRLIAAEKLGSLALTAQSSGSMARPRPRARSMARSRQTGRYFDREVGEAVAASMHGAVLFGTDGGKPKKERRRVSLAAWQQARRESLEGEVAQVTPNPATADRGRANSLVLLPSKSSGVHAYTRRFAAKAPRQRWPLYSQSPRTRTIFQDLKRSRRPMQPPLHAKTHENLYGLRRRNQQRYVGQTLAPHPSRR